MNREKMSDNQEAFNDYDKSKIGADIEYAFKQLIGPLAVMSALNSYKASRKEIKSLLSIIIGWGAKFQVERDLNFITREELLDVYGRLDRLKEEYVFKENMGYEGELSDEATIWIWEIMKLRKALIELESKNMK